jgi:hypothetical protein
MGQGMHAKIRFGLGLIPMTLFGCFEPSDDHATGDGGDDGSSSISATGIATLEGDGSSGASADDDGETTSNASGQADDSGIIFDVGNLEGTGDDDGTTGTWDGPGSCRMSERFGAAGGYPEFEDDAYEDFLGKSVLVMTSHDRLGGDKVLRIFDISGEPPVPNMNYAAPMYTHESWIAPTFGGGTFGLTLDSYGNIYVAATSIYSGVTSTPGTIYKVDEVSVFVELPNSGPSIGNINYDCNSETIRATNHEDGRIYQIEMDGDIRSTYHHGTGDVSLGDANDPGEPDGQFIPLGQRVWAVQSHYGKLYYSVWWEDSGRNDATHDNEIWSVELEDDTGIPDGSTAKLEATIPGLGGNSYSNPVSDLSFAQTGWMLAAERSMYADNSTSAHQSTTYELQQMGGDWTVVGETYVVGELPNSSAGGVDHDFGEEGYVWMTGDALDFYTPDVVYGVQGTPYGGGTIVNSTLIDHDGDLVNQYKTDLGDCEIPIPGDATPPPPPPEG